MESKETEDPEEDRPPMDLFKAIFENDDEDEAKEDDDSSEEEQAPPIDQAPSIQSSAVNEATEASPLKEQSKSPTGAKADDPPQPAHDSSMFPTSSTSSYSAIALASSIVISSDSDSGEGSFNI